MQTDRCDLCSRPARTDSEGLCSRCRAEMARLDAEAPALPRQHRWETVDGIRSALLLRAPARALGFGGSR